MKLAIFGTTGRTGKPLLVQALEVGHEVVVLVRDETKLEMHHAKLTVIKGDILKLSDVERTIAGVDVVLNTIGHVKGSAPDLQVRAIDNILKAMQQHNVSRLITMTGAGVLMPDDQPKFIDKIFRQIIRLASSKAFHDSIAYVDRVRQSNVEWTVVRAPRLTNGPRTGNVQVGRVGGDNMSTQISRADVAQFMLLVAEQGTYRCEAPMISA